MRTTWHGSAYALLSLCEGNPLATSDPRASDAELVCFLGCQLDEAVEQTVASDLRRRWFETPWHRCDVSVMYVLIERHMARLFNGVMQICCTSLQINGQTIVYCSNIWWYVYQEERSTAWISNRIPQMSMSCNYLSMPEILKFGIHCYLR